MGFAEGFAAMDTALTNRRRLQLQADERNQELQKQGYDFSTGQMKVRPDSAAEAEQLQAKEAAQLAKALQGKLAAMDTDYAFENYGHTGDASYLQSALDQNPLLKQAWGEKGVQLIGNIDFDNDTNLLSNSGLTPTHYDTEEKRDILKRNLYKIYNGKEWSVGLANKAVAETGATTRLGKRNSEVFMNNYEQFANLMRGPKVSPYTAEGHKYENLIMAAAEKYDLPPNLIAAQIHKESRGDPKAVSPKGAGGLMQLMPETAKSLGVTDVHDPAQNIDGGAKYMRQLLDKYDGDLLKALAAYNAGSGNVDKYNGMPPFGETQDYVSSIMNNLDAGEVYYGSSADNVAKIILEHRRAIANASQGTTNENIDQGVKNDTRRLDQADVELGQKDKELELKQQENLIKLATDGKTANQKDLDAAENTTKSMLDEFGGEDQFYNTDFSKPENFNKAYRSMVRIEKLEGTQLSEADKKTITEVRGLISLGDPASKLTGDQTGMVDSTLKGMESYFNDNVGGTAAKSAYSAFRNSVRHALFGSALTEGEIKSFNDAYGSLGNKLGPALEMFETSLSQIQAKLDSTASLMNPYSAKIRLGADQKKLTEIRDALQARIDYVKGLQSGTVDPKTGKAKERKPLDDIFKAK